MIKSESEKLDELKQLPGIGPKTAQDLMDAGIDSLEAVAIQRPDELMAILGWNRLKSKEAINKAKELALDTAMSFRTLRKFKEEITDKIDFISTGSKTLDDLIGGGIATNELTGLKGPQATGKTQIAMTAAVMTIRLGRKVAWIETEPNTFKDARFLEIAEGRGIDVDIDDDIYVLDAKQVGTVNHQFLAYQLVERLIKRGNDIGLIVIDSFSTHFRNFYTDRTMLRDRSVETGRHLGFLQTLAANYNLAVLMTCQVMGIPDASKQLEVKMKEHSDEALYGGHQLKHGVQTWLSLRIKSKSSGLWEADLFDSTWKPSGTARFQIDKTGVRDP